MEQEPSELEELDKVIIEAMLGSWGVRENDKTVKGTSVRIWCTAGAANT